MFTRQKKMKIILHIGLPKTGTSYIQRGLSYYHKELRKKGVLVPLTGLHPAARDAEQSVYVHHLLAWALQESRADLDMNLIQPRKIWGQLRKELAESKCHTAILSSEVFYWELRSANDLIPIQRNLDEYDIQIHVGLRRPSTFLKSMYLQAVKDWNYFGSVFDFLFENLDVLRPGMALAKWRGVFGAQNVSTYIYEDMPREAYFGSFMKTLGVAGLGEPQQVDLSQNMSIPEGYLDVLRSLARQGKFKEKTDLFDSLVGMNLPPKKVFSGEEAEFVDKLLLSGFYDAEGKPLAA